LLNPSLPWLLGAAWPRWLADGIDRERGSFFEALALDGSGCTAGFRRLRVAARQIFVFSAAHRHGVPGAAEAVRIGLRFLEAHAAQADGGYAWRFDLDHRVIDATRDLYDHAFVLLAMSSATSVVPAAELRPRAEALLAWITQEFAHASGGFVESLPPALPRRQNPHMHLLEAALAAHEAFGGGNFLAAARTLADLFQGRIFDDATGSIPEFFDEDWKPERRGQVFLVEPGHHCEWAWLLDWYQRLAGADARLQSISERLMDFVDRYGIGPNLHLVDVLGSDGSIIEAGARLWPQTEWLRAEHLRANPDPARQAMAVRSLARLLRPDGLWHERRAADGTLWQGPAPASSLYHLTGAILFTEQTPPWGRLQSSPRYDAATADQTADDTLLS
jgi:mannose-6-phosphate isomerase